MYIENCHECIKRVPCKVTGGKTRHQIVSHQHHHLRHRKPPRRGVPDSGVSRHCSLPRKQQRRYLRPEHGACASFCSCAGVVSFVASPSFPRSVGEVEAIAYPEGCPVQLSSSKKNYNLCQYRNAETFGLDLDSRNCHYSSGPGQAENHAC